MATIKSYTDLEQSKKLAEILPLESADMYYIFGDEYDICFGSGIYEDIADWLSDGTPRPADIPCWSLAALLEVLPYPYIEQNYKGKWICRVEHENTTYLWEDSNLVDACVAMIEKLNELNLL